MRLFARVTPGKQEMPEAHSQPGPYVGAASASGAPPCVRLPLRFAWPS